MLTLYIANKNYSSWSLRPWVLMRERGIEFDERLVHFGGSSFKSFSPTGKVPCLVDGDTVVWDSLAITEYLAERFPGIWPAEADRRTWARCAAAEMHSSFGHMRNICTMNCGIRVRLRNPSTALRADWERMDEIWNEGLRHFGGPFLAGKSFTAVDAFFAPVAFRVQTYRPEMSAAAGDYAQRLLGLKSMREWYAAALQEPWREEAHEAEAREVGEWLEDHRVAAE